jgi:ribonuclease P protein subunit RPR2
MNEQLAAEQTLRYAEEFSTLYTNERAERRRAEDALARLEASYATTVRALAAALDLRDDATGRHAERVTALALELARRVAPELAEEQRLAYGFLLHDIGKIGIPDALLRKPGPLEPDELELMRTHPELGRKIVEGVPYLRGVASDVIGSHHEHWDGSGYPNALRGTTIPLGARIFTIADAWDAMTNDRPYRAACSTEEALRRIEAASATQFDPALVATFLSLPPTARTP